MKNLLFLLGLVLFFSIQVKAINRIEGTVYDENHLPVPDAFVELQNSVESLLSRTKTNNSGRFTFLGVSAGLFKIKVLPLGKNLIGEVQDIEVNNQLSTSDTVFVEFYLRSDKRTSEGALETAPEAIFVQDVPQKAQKLYEKGVKSLEKKQETGLVDLEEAVKIFPAYFNALSRLGREYNDRKNYDKAYPYLLRAIDVNPRSFSSFYSLSYAFYQLGQIPAALKAAQAVILVNASSVEGQLLYGTLLRINGNYQEAEKTLIKAKLLAKKPISAIHWQLALLYNRLNRNQEAANELETYLKISPESAEKKEIKDLISKLKASK